MGFTDLIKRSLNLKFDSSSKGDLNENKTLYEEVLVKLPRKQSDYSSICSETYYDWNNDGEDELLTCYAYANTSYCVLDIYKAKNGQVETLLQTDFFSDIAAPSVEYGVVMMDNVKYLCLHEENISCNWPEEMYFGTYRLFLPKNDTFTEVALFKYCDMFLFSGHEYALWKDGCVVTLNDDSLSFEEGQAWREALEWQTKVKLL